MKERNKLKGKVKSIALTLTIAMVFGAFGMLPGVMQTGHAAMHYEVYVDDSISNGTVTSEPSETSGSGETVTLTVTPDDGYKLKKLSVIQPDVLSSISDLVSLMGGAEFATNGGYSVKIDEGQFSIFYNGTEIANLDNSANLDNDNASYGYYRVISGHDYWYFYIIGGKLRTIAFQDDGDYDLYFTGTGAKTISGTELETTTVTEGTKYTFAAPRSNVYVTAEFEMLEPKTVLIDVGKGHESLFTADVLDGIRSEFDLTAATIEGNIIKLEGVNPSNSEYELWEAINDCIDSLVWENHHKHNGESFFFTAYKPIDKYASEGDVWNDIFDDSHKGTKVSDNLKYYLLWYKPYTKLEMDNGNPVCGKAAKDAKPTVPEGILLFETRWSDANDESIESFEAGKEYKFEGDLEIDEEGPLWRYFIDSSNFTLTVKGGKDVKCDFLEGYLVRVTFNVTADHDWDEGTVTKEPTTSAEGEKLFKCKHCGATKTEAIPKIKPTPAKAKSTAKNLLVANGVALGKRGVNFAWNNVKADRYAIYLGQCNYKGKTYAMKRVKIVNGKTFKWKRSNLKKNTAYKFYVVAQKKSGSSYKNVAKSNMGHFFTGNVRGKYTNPKSLKLSRSALTLKKGRSATIKGSVAKVKKNKALATSHAPMLRYMSNNPTVAAVNASGKVTAKKAGTAVIYVQTINGIWKTCKVTVK